MKEKTLAFCRKIFLAVKAYDKDEYDNEHEGITIVDTSEITTRVQTNLNRLRTMLSMELPELSGEENARMLYNVIDELPLRCDNCSHVQRRMNTSAVETCTNTVRGYCNTSAWAQLDGDCPSYSDETTDTDDGDIDVDEFNVECEECGNTYDTNSWTVAVPRDFADHLFTAASIVSGNRVKTPTPTTPAKPAILNQFSEIKHRTQLEFEEYANSDDGVVYPLSESMEKTL
jgi:hypothetical protein